jgi:hypothetical protein
MDISEFKLGQRVIPIGSTHPNGPSMDNIYNNHMHKGYLIVCDVDVSGAAYHASNVPTIRAATNGRKKAWGNSNKYSWLRFRPEDLEPVSRNALALGKYLGGSE